MRFSPRSTSKRFGSRPEQPEAEGPAPSACRTKAADGAGSGKHPPGPASDFLGPLSRNAQRLFGGFHYRFGSGLARDETAADGLGYGLDTVSGAELGHDAGYRPLHGLGAEEDRARDLVVRHALD